MERARHKFSLLKESPILALCPGAEFGPAKRWPEEHYADIARERLSEGWQVWLLGSEKDRAVTERIQALSEQSLLRFWPAKRRLQKLLILLSVADAVVSNDFGTYAYRSSFKRPLVVVYGSSDPRFTPPLADAVKILSLGLPCSPCFERECPLQHLECLRGLSPEKVKNALREVIV